jgi:hypothetical protein
MVITSFRPLSLARCRRPLVKRYPKLQSKDNLDIGVPRPAGTGGGC